MPGGLRPSEPVDGVPRRRRPRFSSVSCVDPGPGMAAGREVASRLCTRTASCHGAPHHDSSPYCQRRARQHPDPQLHQLSPAHHRDGQRPGSGAACTPGSPPPPTPLSAWPSPGSTTSAPCNRSRTTTGHRCYDGRTGVPGNRESLRCFQAGSRLTRKGLADLHEALTQAELTLSRTNSALYE
jgi:hypothetical protein